LYLASLYPNLMSFLHAFQLLHLPALPELKSALAKARVIFTQSNKLCILERTSTLSKDITTLAALIEKTLKEDQSNLGLLESYNSLKIAKTEPEHVYILQTFCTVTNSQSEIVIWVSNNYIIGCIVYTVPISITETRYKHVGLGLFYAGLWCFTASLMTIPFTTPISAWVIYSVNTIPWIYLMVKHKATVRTVSSPNYSQPIVGWRPALSITRFWLKMLSKQYIPFSYSSKKLLYLLHFQISTNVLPGIVLNLVEPLYVSLHNFHYPKLGETQVATKAELKHTARTVHHYLTTFSNRTPAYFPYDTTK
jgi:hypothetical protein